MRLGVCSRWLFLLFICSALFASSAFAQTGTTSIRGSINDKSGGVIPGAQVKLSSRALAVERTTITTSTGQYEFLALQPGTYDLAIEAKGFRKSEQKGIELLVNNPTTLNLTLEVGTSTETVSSGAGWRRSGKGSRLLDEPVQHTLFAGLVEINL